MTDKQIINGIKYEKLAEEELYDLSQWELVDIILAYREDLKAKEQECEELKGIRDSNFLHALEEQKRADKLSKTLTEIKEIAEDESYIGFWDEQITEILQKISECEGNDG